VALFRADEQVIGSNAKDSIALGRYRDEKTGRIGPKIQFPGAEPIVVIGRNRSGKDAGIGNYNGLQLEGKSWFVLDPRGEGAAICAKYRRTLGPTWIINPDGLHTETYADLKSDKRNPLAGIDWGSRFFDETAAKAEAYVRIEGKEPHFCRRARGNLVHPLVQWEVMRAAIEGRPPSISNVRTLLTEADEFDPKTGKQIKGLAVTAQRPIAEGGPQIASQIAGFVGKMNDEIASVRATADGQTQFMLSPLIAADMNPASGGVDFRELGGERPCSCFVILPQYMLETHSQFLREALSAALRALYKPSKTVCAFWINEFATLGRLEAIESALGMVAGCGIQLIFVLQSLTQLKLHYEDGWENFLGQAGCVALVGPPADEFTAAYLSRRSGEKTICQPNAGWSMNPGGLGLSNGEAFTRVQHLLPQDLYKLQTGCGFVWAAGLADPIPAYFPGYYDVERLNRRARANPYYKG
jgi:type IV secretion system protein VirD4